MFNTIEYEKAIKILNRISIKNGLIPKDTTEEKLLFSQKKTRIFLTQKQKDDFSQSNKKVDLE